MHVLILTLVYPNPGNAIEGLFNEQHAQALARRGIRVTVVVCKPWLPDLLAKRWRRYRELACLPQGERRNGIPVLYTRYLHIPQYRFPEFTVTSCVRSIRETIHQLNPSEPFDVIQVHCAFPTGFAAPQIADILVRPFVLTLHIQDEPRLYASKNGNPLYKKMLERASAVITVGRPLDHFLRAWSENLSGKPLRVIPNGVDLKVIKEILKEETSNPKPGGHIISVANLWPVKGIDLNLKALAKLNGVAASWQYTIVGEGPERTRLERLARDLGIAHRVHFTGRLGHRETLREIFKADIFSLPSWQEAFGVVYLEAMACGKPVIGCRGQGAEDIIRHGIDGLLVEPKSVGEMERALRQFLEKPDFARKLGDSGKSRAQEFTWERNAGQYLELYREICSH